MQKEIIAQQLFLYFKSDQGAFFHVEKDNKAENWVLVYFYHFSL